ncbi:uncharacterized protein UV8b_03368 [Ustilaginoidea virens]|uniref:Uncharacterized protein n=1 Tax=Ustilaginoidea virens TaxID=1159556 RepID=A0A8E5MGP2_USTVR|nr:uncharacterized protein UV8b_03368 [Ustilaginoidea virens]QUC19127.1 hypothetical protein UV8b_03368 [Ustilaginoidea virens]
MGVERKDSNPPLPQADEQQMASREGVDASFRFLAVDPALACSPLSSWYGVWSDLGAPDSLRRYSCWRSERAAGSPRDYVIATDWHAQHEHQMAS